MRKFKERRMGIFCVSCLLLSTVAFSGCGKEDAGEPQTVLSEEIDSSETADVEDTAVNPAEEEADVKENSPEEPDAEEGAKEASVIEPFTEEDLQTMQYMEKIALEDYYGDLAEYDTYAPKGSEIEDGMAFYYEHGLMYSAEVCNFGNTDVLYQYLDMAVNSTMEDWQREGSGYSDVQKGEKMPNGEDRYQIITAMKEDFYGTSYAAKQVFYMSIKQKGIGILWELELSEISADSETELIIDEMARCYQISLDELKTEGEWLAGDAERAERQQDVYEPKEGNNVLEKVEGYEYMGLTTLTVNDGAAQCQVMAPMGAYTTAVDDTLLSSMHGVQVSGSIAMLVQQNFMANVKGTSDAMYKYHVDDTERDRDVWKSEMMPVSAFDEAYCVVITYEEKDYITEEYAPQVDVLCFIRINDDYCLHYFITLKYDEYDNSTNTVLGELETAYGLDLSDYYKE